ncbi:hypothetical protein LJR225_004303 [Phenylobacterium sp. LjRoot225]|uniref:hypothetical protein n=1 Tax=Phenylobacterium sp. LjRoot225 TaxID=3342285 RepID=UPI003ECEFDE5
MDAPDAGGAPTDELPFAIELWNRQRTAPERIIGRALNATLARAIFQSARGEYPDRRIRLRRGAQVVIDTN